MADAVCEIDGVAGLYGGVFGEIATYLPGSRINGVSLSDARGEVHIVAAAGSDLLAVGARARDIAESITGKPISVTIDDIAASGGAAAAERGVRS
ncbi:hypothetical protein [Williamsia muralis]|uniref:Uncharacterized protein n=1 Tax=Williamsia marianensis TaxID=85044 RepID=A0ABU4EVG9_WILMA|nr:hypothetical protein [Williamsia muralis]MDV7135255.1 hypothetical protein [Williamsia muralis]